jgi:hypothetical protein
MHKCNGSEMKAVGRHPFIWLPLHESLTMKVSLKIGSELRMLIQWNLFYLSLHFPQLCFQNMGAIRSPGFTSVKFFFCKVLINKIYGRKYWSFTECTNIYRIWWTARRMKHSAEVRRAANYVNNDGFQFQKQWDCVHRTVISILTTLR